MFMHYEAQRKHEGNSNWHRLYVKATHKTQVEARNAIEEAIRFGAYTKEKDTRFVSLELQAMLSNTFHDLSF